MDALNNGQPAAYSYPIGPDRYNTYETRSNGHPSSQGHGGPGGPGYAHLPSHQDDIRRLIEESTAAKESARVLAEALVFTRPEDLDSKPIIKVRSIPFLLWFQKVVTDVIGVLPEVLPRARVAHQPNGLGSSRGISIS